MTGQIVHSKVSALPPAVALLVIQPSPCVLTEPVSCPLEAVIHCPPVSEYLLVVGTVLSMFEKRGRGRNAAQLAEYRLWGSVSLIPTLGKEGQAGGSEGQGHTERQASRGEERGERGEGSRVAGSACPARTWAAALGGV